MKIPFDANKLYTTEILSILLQNTPDNRKLLGELDGIDVLLQQLAVGRLIKNIIMLMCEAKFFYEYCEDGGV